MSTKESVYNDSKIIHLFLFVCIESTANNFSGKGAALLIESLGVNTVLEKIELNRSHYIIYANE